VSYKWASERKALRKIYRPASEKEGWRIKYNYEPHVLYNAPKRVKTVKLGRFR
jgi:hypothetical protein